MRKIIFIIFILIIAGVATYYIFTSKSDLPGRQAGFDGNGVPDLNRLINIPAEMPEELQKSTRIDMENLIISLKQNPDSLPGWLNLGVYRKLIKDYEGAKQAWEYANQTWPKNSISFQNLGDLYQYEFKDYEKAELNYKKSLENDPIQDSVYEKLYEMYLYNWEGKADLAGEILQEGLKANPNDAYLKILLDNYNQQAH